LFQDSARLRSILGKTLNLKISIADHRAVAAALWQARERSMEDVIERLVSALRPDHVEIQLPPEYLKQITVDHATDGTGMFSFLREGMYLELGLTYPKFRFVIAEDLKPRRLRFKINHLTTPPLIGLRSDQCLVNDTIDRLPLIGIDAKAAINPASGQPASVVDISQKTRAEEYGLTTWDQMGYLILTFAEALRKNSACFVHREVVENQLDQLGAAFPALVKAARTQASSERLTRVLRGLVEEEISIRNLRLILERLLGYSYSFSDSSRYLILDDRPNALGRLNNTQRDGYVSLVSFLRAGMKRQIGNKLARGTNTLVAYLLDLQIERITQESQDFPAGANGEMQLDDSLCEDILDAIRQEVAWLPLTATRPSILTSIAARPFLRQIVADEFPRIPVVAYQDLAPDLNIQPVARISLNI
jgi:type III secretion protein V